MWQDYEVLEEVGSGASGVVYRARHRGLGRLVALKVLRSPEVGPDEAERFRREAALAGNLDHPNIAPVYESGEHEGRLFYAMKLIEGADLSQAGPALRANWKRLAVTLAVVARALHYAHDKGVIHRDLKPANIVLDSDGQPHLVDFGLARSAQSEKTLTATGVILGTPAYTSPEQAAGRKDLTRAADVWALGVILYELLTGRLPFSGPTPYATLLAIRTQKLVPPRTINTSVPPDLQAICLRCLEKAPADRYPSAQALAEDLERFGRGEGVRPGLPSGRRARARRWAAAVLALGVLGLGLFGIHQGWQWWSERREPPDPVLLDADRQRLGKLLEDHDYEAFLRLMEQQPAWWRPGLPSEWLRREAEIRPALLFTVQGGTNLRWSVDGKYLIDESEPPSESKVYDGRTGRLTSIRSVPSIREPADEYWPLGRWGKPPGQVRLDDARVNQLCWCFGKDRAYWDRPPGPFVSDRDREKVLLMPSPDGTRMLTGYPQHPGDVKRILKNFEANVHIRRRGPGIPMQRDGSLPHFRRFNVWKASKLPR